MIEKLKKQNTWGECLEKLNELIDAVNEIMTWRFETDDETPEKCETPVDPYAQYRGWAGKLCRFWNIDKDKAIYGILEEVKADWAYRFQMKGEKYLFDHCEPVKPDDDIIYRGE